MPIYEANCPKCGKTADYYARIEFRDETPVCCGARMHKQLTAAHVTPDIEPYKAVAADKETGKVPYITSRKKHREFLKKNGYEEVGNEKFTPKPKDDSKGGDAFMWGDP